MSRPSILVVALQYTLPIINIAFIVWMILMNHAFVHPTSFPTSYALRSHGLRYFSIFYLSLCASAIALSIANIYTLQQTYRSNTVRYKRFKHALTFRHIQLHVPVATLVFVFIGSYALISSLAFRTVFSQLAYRHACNGYALMAEIEVLSGFGFNGGNSSVLGASSRVRFFNDGRHVYTMDLIRDYRMTLGFSQYQPGSLELESNAYNSEWGLLSLELKTGRSNTGYYNATRANQTRNAGVKAPGPIGAVLFDLRTLSYDATYTNATFPSATFANATFSNTTLNTFNTSSLYPTRKTGTFTTAAHNLSFPSLRLQQSSSHEWRFTDHVCLPPRISLGDPGDIWGEMSWDCQKYRICALRHGSGDERWWDWVENVWPIITGVVAWEVERYSACCVSME